jgi:hypothetical protein
MAFNFKELSLSGVEVSTAAPILSPGRYVVTVKNAQLKDTKNKGNAVELSMTDTNGSGSLRGWLNVFVPSSKVATRIGREQLKALLTFGQHPNPDSPGDIKTLIGLTVGISVGQDTYEKDGVERVGSKLKGFFDPSEIEPDAKKNQSSSPRSIAPTDDAEDVDDLVDEIPF